ncbi:MAG: hypothetical protein HY273_15205 [Gammaproteobacteria bacterium]|nr:hypothetical protein [Gammaproteobacteria bacterium]
MHITSGRKLHALASGLTARSALEKFAAVQMIDVMIPTSDGREIQLTRYTQPEPELKLLLDRLKLTLPELTLPEQPSRKLPPHRQPLPRRCSADLDHDYIVQSMRYHFQNRQYAKPG